MIPLSWYLTTAAVLTYYPPGRRLTVSYAGHPRGWWYRADHREWQRLEAGDAAPGAGPLVDLPLATGLSPAFAQIAIIRAKHFWTGSSRCAAAKSACRAARSKSLTFIVAVDSNRLRAARQS